MIRKRLFVYRRAIRVGYVGVLIFYFNSCAEQRIYPTSIKIGMSIDTIELVLGTPDVILESSGDEGRTYTPENPPDARWKWPDSRLINYYYLEDDLDIVIQNLHVIKYGKIDLEQRDDLDRFLTRIKDQEN